MMRLKEKFVVSSNPFYSNFLILDIFRPFPGFKSVRLIPREKLDVILCFADFETPMQTTVVINTLQGYRFDKDDIWGLQFSYANKQLNDLEQNNNSKPNPRGITSVTAKNNAPKRTE